MFRWFTSLFASSPAVTETVEPGVRVRRIADALEGTVSGLVHVGEQTVARVVFCGHRTTWVDLVPLGDLEVA